MKAIVLSGGLGTRLRPLTCVTPKALLPLLNRPFLEYQLDLLKRCKINEIVFCLNYKPELFKKYFNKSKVRSPKSKIKINCVSEKFPLGTGGAVKNALRSKEISARGGSAFVGKEPVMILNGDVFTEVNLGNFLEFHKKKKSAVTILLTPVEDPTLYGLVETDKTGKIKHFVEKPSLPVTSYQLPVTSYTINAGIYLFEPEIFDYIPEGINYSLEHGLFPLLLQKGLPLYGYIYNGYWLDIGTVEKYLQVHFDLMNRKVRCSELEIRDWRLGKGKLVVGKNTKIPHSVQVLGNVCVGKNCFLGGNVILKDCVILNNVFIGEGAKIENCAVGNNCKIESYAVLNPGTALGDGSVVKEYSKL